MGLLRLIFCCLLSSALTACALRGGSGEPAPRKGEFRGVWVATVKNLDLPRSRNSAEFRKNFIRIADRIAAAGCTAVIFQVRPNCDAFYPSAHAPWSASLFGAEGRGPEGNFDPLAFMIAEAHKRKLEFHAWLNPYRVASGIKEGKAACLRKLDRKNFARRNPNSVLCFANGGSNQLFLDPSDPAVIRHVTSVAYEIALNYPVDAVHFDDYFYPYEEIGTLDAKSFAARNPRRLALGDWRRANTEALVLSVRNAIDAANRKSGRRVQFGISPFGIWANRASLAAGSATKGKQSYFNLYADTRKWVRNRYIDYIVPQIYWNFAHESAAYGTLAQWWCDTVRGSGVRLYIGHGIYQLTASGWSADEAVNQLRFNRARPEISGSAFFSYRHLCGDKLSPGAKRLLRELTRR